jgi:hypothetical protein
MRGLWAGDAARKNQCLRQSNNLRLLVSLRFKQRLEQLQQFHNVMRSKQISPQPAGSFTPSTDTSWCLFTGSNDILAYKSAQRHRSAYVSRRSATRLDLSTVPHSNRSHMSNSSQTLVSWTLFCISGSSCLHGDQPSLRLQLDSRHLYRRRVVHYFTGGPRSESLWLSISMQAYLDSAGLSITA